MAQAPIRSHVDVPLDIHGDVAAQIALDFVSLIEDLTDFDHVLVGQIIALQVKGDSGLLKDSSRGTPADPINVGERDFHAFASREIDSCDACHIFLSSSLCLKFELSLSLSLLVLRVDTQHSHDSLALDDFAFVANFFYRGSNLHDNNSCF